ncbi:hypothetical protein TSOC_014616, partial [Tetrabaena socialis]
SIQIKALLRACGAVGEWACTAYPGYGCAPDGVHRECLDCRSYLRNPSKAEQRLNLLLDSLDAEDDDEANWGFVAGGRSSFTARVQRPDSDAYLSSSATCGGYVRCFNELPTRVTPQGGAEGAAIDAIVSVLHRLPKVGVYRVHKGGSYGRNTHVRGRFDVDLLVFVNGFDPADERHVERVLQQAAAMLEQELGCVAKCKPELQMLQLTVHGGVEMDVLFVSNVATDKDQDKAAAQRRVLVVPLLRNADAGEIGAPDRARERAVSEALTVFVRRQHGTANRAVRLF